jgi:hypothetical protein
MWFAAATHAINSAKVKLIRVHSREEIVEAPASDPGELRPCHVFWVSISPTTNRL